MNYFEFYELPITLVLDENILKKRFHQKSKEFHPDFYLLESEEKQNEVLAISTFNNEAYKTLKDADLRLKYVLNLFGQLDDAQNSLPQSFLMEMMEVNEEIMELQFSPNSEKTVQLINKINEFESDLTNLVEKDLINFQGQQNFDFANLKNYYLKKKYLKRLKDNLNGKEAEI